MTDSALLTQIKEAVYIEDCHITGMHDPTHSQTYICEAQLANAAKRVIRVLYGVDLAGKDVSVSDKNKIPRKITSYWYGYYQEHYPDKAKELEDWRDNGYKE